MSPDAATTQHPAETPGGAAALARNMSTPPRMDVTIRPLGGEAACRPGPAAGCAPPGFTLHARIDLDALFERHLPGTGGAPSPRTRLGRLVLIARRILDSAPTRRPAGGRPHARSTTMESLGDEFLDLAARIEPRTLGLPNFALVRRIDAGPPAELDPARTLAIVSRQDGRLFLAGRSPAVPRLDDPGQLAFGLYVPDGGRSDGRA